MAAADTGGGGATLGASLAEPIFSASEGAPDDEGGPAGARPA